METEYVYNSIAVSILVFILTSAVCSFFHGLIALGTLITILVILVLVFVVIPVVFKYTPSLQKGLLFLSSVNLPVDFQNPSKLVPASRNFYIYNEKDGNVKLGVWQILPQSLASNVILTPSNEQFENWLTHGEPVIIYMHGNSGNRGTGHRIDLYKLLQNNNFHVIAFDYRNYGDSGRAELSENGTVSDARAVYSWTKEMVKGKTQIFFWGHSLGTGISSHLLDDLEREQKSVVTGLILEAPFNNLEEEIRAYPLAQIWRFLPWFDHFFTLPMKENGLLYRSDRHLLNVKAPILILHAEDDRVIPISLSKKLYANLVSTRGKGTVEFKTYPSDKMYGHKFIVRDPQLPEVIKNFVKKSSALKRT